MKTLTVVWMVVFFGLVLMQAHAGERTFGDGTLPSFLEIYDVDGDGVLSEEERQAMRVTRRERHEKWIEKWDTDGDGVISEEEKDAARVRLREMIEECREDRFNEADTDQDGYLTYEEFIAIPAVAALLEKHPEKPVLIFDRLDADDDNLVSLEEFLSCLRSRSRPSQEG